MKAHCEQPQAVAWLEPDLELTRRLIVEGITQLHFYTLNQADLTVAACRLLGLRPAVAAAAAAA